MGNNRSPYRSFFKACVYFNQGMGCLPVTRAAVKSNLVSRLNRRKSECENP